MIENLRQINDIAEITYPVLGVYDVPDAGAFRPIAAAGYCVFEHFSAWLRGESTLINSETASAFSCPGAGYWLCGIESMPKQAVAEFLAGAEGLKRSPEVMCRWLENAQPYTLENISIVISTLREDQYAYLKTATFFVNPDQLAVLLTGADYLNTSVSEHPVVSPYGSGCGQLLTLFPNLDEPQAMIGATDIAMRKHLPADILTFTVTKPMLEQLCGLGKDSFLHKTYLADLKQSRR